MKILEYDAESDSLYVNVSSKKAFLTAELSPRIGVDLSQSKSVVGVELLGASKVISELFGSRVPKSKVGKMLCRISDGDALYLNFELGKKHASLAIPKTYKSPVLAAPA